MRALGVGLVVGVMLCFGLTGCDSSDSPESAETGSLESFPTCAEIKAALGPAVENLVELPDSENGPMEPGEDTGVMCSWHTKQIADQTLEVEQYGGIGVGVTTMAKPYVESEMRESGYVVDDPRAAKAGAYVIKFDGSDFNPSELLDALGVQVVIGDTAVVLTAGGVMLQDVPELAALTNDWAIGGGVRVWETMR